MKSLMAILLCLIAPVTFAGAALTGKTLLSCQAILCLPAPSPPGACMPSLNEYFSIDFDDFGDTLKARLNFLNLCPKQSISAIKTTFDVIVKDDPSVKAGLDKTITEIERSNKLYKPYINALVQGSGRCHPVALNATKVPISTSSSNGFGLTGGITKYCPIEQLPSYCNLFYNHSWIKSVNSKPKRTPNKITIQNNGYFGQSKKTVECGSWY